MAKKKKDVSKIVKALSDITSPYLTGEVCPSWNEMKSAKKQEKEESCDVGIMV